MNYFNSQNVIVNFKKSRNGFYYAIEDVNSFCLINYLGKHNIGLNQYKDADLGSCNEIVDDILSNGDNVVIFQVNVNNLYITSTITNISKDEEENLKIIWVGEVLKEIMFEISNVNFDTYVFDIFEANILYLIENKKSNWKSLSGVYINHPEQELEQIKLERVNVNTIAPIYSDGIAAVQNANMIGLFLGKKCYGTKNEYEFCNSEIVISEFTKISKEYEHLNSIKLHIENFFDYPRWEQLLEKLHQININCKFDISVYGSSLNETTIKKFVEYNVGQLTLYVTSKKDGQVLKKNLKLLTHYIKVEKFIEVSLYVYDEVIYEYNGILDLIEDMAMSSKIIKCGKFSIKTTCKYNKSFKEMGRLYITKETERMVPILAYINQVTCLEYNGTYGYEVPLINGNVAMMTGNYSNINNTSVKHMVVDYKDFNFDLFDYFRDYTSVNSGLYIECDDNSQISKKGRIYIEEECNAVKYENELYSAFYQEAFERNYCLSHLCFIKNEPANTKRELHFNNYKRDMVLTYDKIPLSEVLERTDKEKVEFLNYISLDSKEDLKQLLIETDYFVKTGKIDKINFKNAHVINACRWGLNGLCRLNNIPRLKIDKENNIYPCFDSNKTLGKINQFHYETVKNSYERTEREFIDRKCMDCSIQMKCTKCVMLPDYLSNDDYCNIRRENPYIPEYLLFLDIFEYLMKNSDYVNEDNIKNINVISNCSYYFSKDIPYGEEEDYLFKPVFIIYIKNNSVMWSPVQSKFFKVSDDLAYIVELMIKNLSVPQIISQIQKDYKLEFEEAKKNTITVYNYLYKAGSIKRQIKILDR